MRKTESNADLLPDLLAFTGLSQKQLDAALEELVNARFIKVNHKKGKTEITLLPLEP